MDEGGDLEGGDLDGTTSECQEFDISGLARTTPTSKGLARQLGVRLRSLAMKGSPISPIPKPWNKGCHSLLPKLVQDFPIRDIETLSRIISYRTLK